MIDKKINKLKNKYNSSYNPNLIIVKPDFWNVPTRPTSEIILNKI